MPHGMAAAADSESAMLVTILPGAYTTIVLGDRRGDRRRVRCSITNEGATITGVVRQRATLLATQDNRQAVIPWGRGAPAAFQKMPRRRSPMRILSE